MIRSFLACLLAVWFLSSSLLAASPALHQWLHDDAGQSSHQCAITLLEHQQLLASDPAQVVALTADEIFSVPAPAAPLHPSSGDDRWSPSRAPPVS